ncbi:MAG: hypothetical protein RJA36_1138 [Pseudomonadota bacterium]|jgi:hypothetical protein
MIVRSILVIGVLALAAAEGLGMLRSAAHAQGGEPAEVRQEASLAPSDYASGPEHVETLLLQVLVEIEGQRLDRALELTGQMLQRFPNYRLGHLIQGDLLLAQAQAIDGLGAPAQLSPERVAELRAEALARLNSYRERPPAGHVPRNLVQMDDGQSHVIVVDAGRSRLYLFKNDGGAPRLVADYYVVQGQAGTDKFREGDKRTPLGVYRITSSLSKDKLIDLYGAAAFPLNYPNEWDRLRGRKGSGIWLHGTQSDTFARPPLASKGCIVLSNQDIELVAPHLQDGITPVIIADRLDWIPQAEFRRQRDDFLALFGAWRADAESRDPARLARYYSGRYKPAPGDAAASAEIDKLSIFRNPGEDDVVVVNFEQKARRGEVARGASRVQYWMRESGGWKIVHEGSA